MGAKGGADFVKACRDKLADALNEACVRGKMTDREASYILAAFDRRAGGK